MRTLWDMLVAVARQNAERTALVDAATSVSYAELEKSISSLAAQLSDVGVHLGDRVALLLPNGLGFVTSYFAIVKLGAIVVPLNDHYQQTELLYFLNACGISLLITSHGFAPLCQQVLAQYASPCRLFFVEHQGDARRSRADLAVTLDPEAAVMYQFSSGSTGRPKRIARTHTQLLFELDGLIQVLHITREDRLLGVAPFSHVNGLMRSMLASVRAGATLYPLAKFARQAVAEVIERHSISVFIAVPFMFNMLAKANFRQRPDFSSLRLCISASAPMLPKLNKEFHQQFGLYVRQLYGSTETGTISVDLSSNLAESLASVGTPISGVEVEVFTDDGRIAAVHEIGELAIKSPAAITGYDGLDGVNRDTFRDGYFFTGDLGKKDQNGLLYLVGRKKFLINKGGYKIDPHEIEGVLETHPKVEEAVVIGLPTAFGDEKVKAVIIANAPCTEEEIVQYCRDQIADFKIPSVLEFREELPKSPTGKIRRTLLM